MFVCDAHGHIRYANASALALLGVPAHAVHGHHVTTFLPALAAPLARCVARAETVSGRELELAPAGTEPRRFDFTLTALGAADRSVLVELYRTDWKPAIAREAERVEQMAAVRALVRALAHELRNPLTGLAGALQILKADRTRGDALALALEEVARLRRLLDGLLAAPHPPERRLISLHDPLEYAVRLLAPELPGAERLVRDYDPSLPDVLADRDALVQIFLNLIRNAAHAAGDRGTIRLRTRVRRQYTLAGRRHRLAVCAEVNDDGPGVAPELAETLFLPLVSGRPEGTGLGLAVAQDLAVREGGLIDYQSRPGATTFVLLLPVPEG